MDAEIRSEPNAKRFRMHYHNLAVIMNESCVMSTKIFKQETNRMIIMRQVVFMLEYCADLFISFEKVLSTFIKKKK
jgi:hypothetical protein